MNQNIIHVAIATDKNFMNHAMVAAASILDHTPDAEVNLYLLYDDLTAPDLERFKTLNKIKAFNLVPFHIEEAFFKSWPKFRGSMSPYYRLALPELLPEVDKIIYLDCDLVVLDDLNKLWEIELGEAPLAAITTKVSDKYLAMLNLPPKARYFNSGVLIMNLRKLRSVNFEADYFEVIKTLGEKLKYYDQDVLNITHNKTFLELPLKWNMVNTVYRTAPENQPHPEPEIREALANPGIAHFNGLHKPWMVFKNTHHPYAFCYRHYAAMAGLPASEQLKLFIKSLLTGRLSRPRQKVPWNSSIINRNIIKKHG